MSVSLLPLPLRRIVPAAGPAHARVTITYARDAVDLAIVDDGAGGTSVNGGGYGLAGMRERAAQCGGSVQAGPDPAGGWRVHANLPLERHAA